MAKFLDEIEGQFLSDENFQLTSDLVYESDIAKRTINVPAGFVTDFASFKLGMMRISIAREAAVVHDYCYRTKGFISKRLADLVFLEAMKVTGIGWWRRTILYEAVRWFGRFSYKGGVKK